MVWLESILIICGISFDIFAQMECQGSLIADIKKEQVIKICLAVVAWQVAALITGHFLASWFVRWKDIEGSELLLGEIMSAVILIALGARQFYESRMKYSFVEHREERLSVKKMLLLLGRVTFYTVLTGIALAFTGAELSVIVVSVVIISIAAVMIGIYTGYNFGFEHREKAYVIGALILVVIGAENFVGTLISL
ncbi:MAG: manganese efflux pump [Lachnospiraceae bacterium]|nr:manganese efflux pump [Lachnospiraceae bacterium]